MLFIFCGLRLPSCCVFMDGCYTLKLHFNCLKRMCAQNEGMRRRKGGGGIGEGDRGGEGVGGVGVERSEG